MLKPDEIDALWDFSNPAATEQRLNSALEQTHDTSIQLEVLTQIARAQGLQGRFDDAHRTLDDVEAQLSGAPPRVHVRYCLERGRTLNSAGKPDDALPLFKQALNTASEAGLEGLAVDAAHMIAIAATGDEQIEWNRKALYLAERSKEPRARRWRASILNNLGWSLHDAGLYEEALDAFTRALHLRTEQGEAETTRIARWCVARCLRSLGRIEEALQAQQALLDELSASGGQDGFAHEEMGECLLALGREDEAVPHFRAALDALRSHPTLASDPARLARLERLAEG